MIQQQKAEESAQSMCLLPAFYLHIDEQLTILLLQQHIAYICRNR